MPRTQLRRILQSDLTILRDRRNELSNDQTDSMHSHIPTEVDSKPPK